MTDPWYARASNPQALASLYPDHPALSSLEVLEVALGWAGGSDSVRVRALVRALPPSPPVRWRREPYNAVHLELGLYGARDVRVARWAAHDEVTLEVAEGSAPGRVRVRLTGAGCEFEVDAAVLTVVSFAPHLTE